MSKTFNEIIEQIATYVNKYREQYGIKVASPIIAQAILESGIKANGSMSSLASKYNNYFGMKCGSAWQGKSVNLKTKEEYTVGTLTSISANFRVYDTMEEGIEGYFKFISAKRYANLKGVSDPYQYLVNIKADGYATSSAYVDNVYNVIKKYDLTKYDSAEWVAPTASVETQTPVQVEVVEPITEEKGYAVAEILVTDGKVTVSIVGETITIKTDDLGNISKEIIEKVRAWK